MITRRARAEQDFYLSFLVESEVFDATEEQREEFYRYDSEGGSISRDNPLLLAKARYGQTISVIKDGISDPWFWCSTYPELCEAFADRPRVLQEVFRGYDGPVPSFARLDQWESQKPITRSS